LKQQRDKLKQYQKKLTLQLEKEKELARELLKQGKKEQAKLLLKKKRFAESMLVKTDAQMDNLEQMVVQICSIDLSCRHALRSIQSRYTHWSLPKLNFKLLRV
jgi:hypothetical protein